ncbi:thiamine-phosphate kinase [Roseisolibacter sp. H3M3-2]|uniref:thiamine-phosphate kinase n=1 Tax=Roseisolibacter sp. H3M3-2 TaxID=3031323 RepID=UPI0023D9B2F6|nr:thiamine-phosphate kinase [Roseisolibacter sp. H3M3-2]MDF1504850.1 thiamine-phosphate kinase [Roseisolibacter sp. H3M3-2]
MRRDAAGHLALGPGGEFDLVRAMVARWGDVARGIGDDAATLDVPPGARLVVSTDASVEGAHFRREWLTPEEIGWRAAASAVSDLAAMAAAPLGMVVALALPDDWRADALAVADGIGALARATGTPIVGGDLVRASALGVTVTVMGSAGSPVGRGGARPGDAVYATVALGGPRQALGALLRGDVPDAAARARFARPVPRVAEARWLAATGATALVDVSDGLAADLRHVAAASGVRLVVEAERVPRFAGASRDDALAGGEEYELALTAPPGLDAHEFAARFGVALTAIGRVEATDGAGVAAVEVVDPAGRRVEFAPGHDHLSG